MSTWGREFLYPDEWASEWCMGWLSREDVPDEQEALEIAASTLGEPVDQLAVTPVLMREESEVEAKINGHECPYWVECTRRARAAEPFWRVGRKQEVPVA